MSNEPYAEYLGEGYYGTIRGLLGADDKICTNTMIDSDIAIGAMKKMLAPYLEKMQIAGKQVQNEADYAIFQQAALYFLAGILCSPIISRAKVPPFLGFKYQKNWGKKREKLMKKGDLFLNSLLQKEELAQ